MKSARILVILFVTVLAIGPISTVSAQNFTYTSSYQVYNLEATEATVTVYFYNKDGSQPTTIPGTTSFTVPANNSVGWFVLQQVSGSFDGSMIIASTKQVASISNVHGGLGGNQYYANASYIAATSGVQSIYIPVLMQANSGYSTWYNVMNTGSADAHVTATYSDGTSNGPQIIKPGAAYTFNQFPGNETHTAVLFSGSVAALSGETIAATVIEESTKVMFGYNGFQTNALSQTPVLPLINTNNSGYTTGVGIQNAGGANTNVTVTYTPSTIGGVVQGTACYETQPIQAGKMASFALYAFTAPGSIDTNCVVGAKFIGSAKITANTAGQNLAIVVNQHKLGTDGSAYDGYNASSATSRVVLPVIMDHNASWWTGFQIMNVGTLSTNVSCSFINSTVTIPSTAVAANASLGIYAWGLLAGSGSLPASYVGSATCNASGGDALIIGIVNENLNGGTTDNFMTYEGINVTP